MERDKTLFGQKNKKSKNKRVRLNHQYLDK